MLKPVAASFRWIPTFLGANRYPPTPGSCRRPRSSERWRKHRTTTRTGMYERSLPRNRHCHGRMQWTVCRCESQSSSPRHCRGTQTLTAGAGRLRWRRRTYCTPRKCSAKGPSQLVAQSVPGTSTNLSSHCQAKSFRSNRQILACSPSTGDRSSPKRLLRRWNTTQPPPSVVMSQ